MTTIETIYGVTRSSFLVLTVPCKDRSTLRKVVARLAHVPCIYGCYSYAVPLLQIPSLQIPIPHHIGDHNYDAV